MPASELPPAAQDLFKVYLRDVAKHHLLTREGEVSVADVVDTSFADAVVRELGAWRKA